MICKIARAEVARSPLVRDERAAFSASWVETVIAKALERGSATVLDPFVGAGTTLLAAEKMGVECLEVEAHPFVARIASAKLLLYRTDRELYLEHIRKVKIRAENLSGCVDNYPALIRSCFSARSLEGLNRLWQAWKQLADDSPQSELVWLTVRSNNAKSSSKTVQNSSGNSNTQKNKSADYYEIDPELFNSEYNQTRKPSLPYGIVINGT
jgi:tRNA G10  N-methylase Trm11